MRVKLVAALALAAVLAGAVAAQAGPVTVALYRFPASGDVSSFYGVAGKSCKKTWRKRKTLGVRVGPKTNACVYRSSVVADSSDPGADQEVAASVNLAASTPDKLSPKIYLGVGVRQGAQTGYELRLLPVARKWQLIRDPRGTAAKTVLASGTGKFIHKGESVRNDISLRAFDFGTGSVTLLAKVNKKKVLSMKDSSGGQPNGRRTVVSIGAKGKAFANRAVGAFDNVAIRVPNPFS
jgi:hypothetical protein